ncbi:MAG: ABC transporter ATP-binding protein [Deltaproteobacteria bacterium]|nr:MAG: ABC transporter ATP-binding protein [Deltaproteobacteria bacterium]
MPGSDRKTAPVAALDIGDQPFVQVEKVSKKFGSLMAVSGVSFGVHEGKICGLVGSDGAGKTTLLRMIATMIRPTAGNIFVGGLNVITQKAKVKEVIGYMPQRFGLYQDLTVAENLDFFMDIYGLSGAERTRRRDYYLGFSNLLPFLNRKAGDLSGGMKQKLGLACVLVHQPNLLILDEPTNGVDPVSRQEFWDILAEMKQKGMTILVSTAYLDEGEKCDQLILMHNAQLLTIATPHEIQANLPDLEEAMIRRIQAVDNALAEDNFGS